MSALEQGLDARLVLRDDAVKQHGDGGGSASEDEGYTDQPIYDLEDDFAAQPQKQKKKKSKPQKQRVLQEPRTNAPAGDLEGTAPEMEDIEGGPSAPHQSIAEKEVLSSEDILKGVDFIKQQGPNVYTIPQGHVKGMQVGAKFFARPSLLAMVLAELKTAGGGFTAAVQQLANVATLPGIVGESIGMPDLHSGYGFAIGNVAAVDMADPQAVVSPGGVGFDINCGVRLLRSDLTVDEVLRVKDRLADVLYSNLPVGVGSEGSVRLNTVQMDRLLQEGMKYTQGLGLSWPEDLDVTEEHGCFSAADPSKVSKRAKARGMSQCGTLGSGNHYCEVQVVDQIFDSHAAEVMGISRVGQICIMIHSGSRGLGHQVCTDYLSACDRVLARHNMQLVDRQLACAPLSSPEGQDYLAAMACAANFAFCNRSIMAHAVRNSFEEVFGQKSKKLGMFQVYDVSHNIAKVEEHTVGGQSKKVLVHRKGATRAFPPGHPAVPKVYQEIGQPVLIGGSMGTASYVLTGTEGAMQQTFGSTCHGAGRALSRSKAMHELDSREVLKALASDGITVRVATKKLVAEEAPASYKDISEVIDTCHEAGISKKVARLRPLIVVKG